MGIKLTRAIGYGIEFERPDYDSRLNNHALDDIYGYIDEMISLHSFDSVRLYMEVNGFGSMTYRILEQLAAGKITKRYNIKTTLSDSYDLIHDCDNTYGIIFYPFGVHDWKQYNSPIDYVYEQVCNNCKMDNKIVFSKTPLSYEGYMYADTGMEITDSNGNNASSDMWALENSSIDSSNFEEFGFKDYNDFIARRVPYVYDDIRALCSLLKIFKDEKSILDLRPMYAEWWS